MNQETKSNFTEFFPNPSSIASGKYLQTIFLAAKTVSDWLSTNSLYKHQEESYRFKSLLPEEGIAFDKTLDMMRKQFLPKTYNVNHPHAMAHLHCPVTLPSLAAEVIISSLNQSMDSWDQSPIATELEQHILTELLKLLELPQEADGCFTTGGTQSNYLGLLLARDNYCNTHLNHDVRKQGLPREANRFRVFCSRHAHFSTLKALMQLGLGEQAIVTVDTDEKARIDCKALLQSIETEKQQGNIPLVIVATAGTTDFGSIDSLTSLATIAKTNHIWLHVDAAVGGALLLSDTHKEKITGLNLADSVAIDFHKLFFQPVASAAFFVKDRTSLDNLCVKADYLNAEKDLLNPMNLVDKSLQTTRRFDALKLWFSLQTIGKKNYGDMIDHLIDLAKQTYLYLSATNDFDCPYAPELNILLFRYQPQGIPQSAVDNLNLVIRKQLYQEGIAGIAKTKLNNQIYLKLTIMNPTTTMKHIQQIISAIYKMDTTRELHHEACG